MNLTDTAIRNAKPKDKDYKLANEAGMYVLIKKTGNIYFRFDYRFAGKRKTFALGVYPETTLKEARAKRNEARKLLNEGIDPSEVRKAKRHNIYSDTNNSFEAIAQEWFKLNKPKWEEETANTKWRRLERNVFPYLGNRPIKNITTQELLSVIRIMESRDSKVLAHKVKNIVENVFAFAISTSRAEINIALQLKGALAPIVSKNMATITDPKEIGALLRSIDNYNTGYDVTKYALKLTPLMLLRPGELRQAEWSEIDFDKKMWKIPKEKMKMKRDHLIPLSKQAIEILESIKPITGHGKYVFPSVRTTDRPMSNVTVLAALRRMGYTKEEICTHGFRAMASTLLNENVHEHGFDSAVIEAQLAHQIRNKVEAAYNRAEHLPQRIKMMQWWADYLDELKNRRG